METKNIFLKKVLCPVCNKTFETPTVKVNIPRISYKDSDFFIRYSIENPYFYDVWICPNCGYSALKTDFSKIRNFQKELIKKNITPKWVNRYYKLPYDEKIAIEKYKLALLSSMTIEAKSSTKAMICLKIAWMYRLLNDNLKEKIFLSQALTLFEDTYSKESLPIYGLDRFSIMFLIGELNRRLDNDSIALKWFSEVITSIGANQKVKEMARDGKDKIRG